MLKIFVTRPVLATVISVLVVVLGIIGLTRLPLQQFPDIAPPAVQVTANYPGANAETVLRSVAPSLEDAINGVENMTYMTSTSSNDGSLTITVYFQLGTNPDQAQVNVQNRVSQATSQLPPEVIQQGVITAKQQNSLIMVVDMFSEDSATYDHTFLANYANINIVPEIKRIPGIAQALVFGGSKDYSMRVWLNPGKMASYNVTPQEVTAAIQDKNLEAAPGAFGQNSTQPFEYVIKYKGKLTKPGDYENIAIRANTDGSVLRLKDVARIEFGSYTYTNFTRTNGKPGINIAIQQLSGSNSNQIQIAVAKVMEQAKKGFPKNVDYITLYNTKIPLDESIIQVEHTLIEAFILVFIVVFIFLQDFRSTLIPAIAVPVAIIGTFFFMNLLGFSLNLLTLFALVLAIGIVVDDAIVVVEAVHAKMEHTDLSPQAATLEAMHEISGAIISITLVMAAVFLPIGFLQGSTGVFFRQFAYTLAIAIVISAVNALTLSPALTALFLKKSHTTGKKGFFKYFNVGFTAVTNKYMNSLKFLTRRKWVAVGGLACILAATVWLVNTRPTGFIPSEDQGFIAIALSMQSGTSLDRTTEVIHRAEKALDTLPFKKYQMGMAGYNLLTQAASSSSGISFILLKPSDQRGPEKDINKIMEQVRAKLATISGADFFVFTFPTVPGFSNVDALDVVLQDKTNGDLGKFSQIAYNYIGELMKRKEILFAFTTFKADFPQLEMEVDNEKADQLGVKVRDILTTMQGYYGSIQASDFNRFGKYYRVVIQADKDQRADPKSIDRIFVKNIRGEMVPINTLIKLKRVYGSENASRYNLFNSIEINALPKPGYSSGDAINAIREVAASQLPAGFSYEFSGQTREEIASNGQSTIVFIICLIFVYFLLSAQYESYILPFAVILSIPIGVFGAFTAIWIRGVDNNIYVQVALIMLIGLLAKNAILIVEFAVQRRRAGLTLIEAALEGSKARLRPIIMTSLAFILGLFPMSVAVGPSAQGNHSISIAAASGMLAGVVIGVLVIPVLFVIFQGLQEKFSARFIKGSSQHLPGTPVATVLLLVFTLSFSACKVSHDVKAPDVVSDITWRVPQKDTSTIADLPWQSFFSDPGLRNLIDTALVLNQDLQVAIKNIQSAHSVAVQAGLGNLPSVDAGAGVTYNRYSDKSFNGLGLKEFLGASHIWDYSTQVSLSWEADIWGKISSRKAQALTEYLQSEEARKAVQTRLVSDVAKGYYNLLALSNQLEIAKRNLVLDDTAVQVARFRFEAGQITSLAIQQTNAQRLAAAQLIPRFERQIAMQENALQILTGRPPASIALTTSLDKIGIAHDLPAGIPAYLLSRRPDVRQSELELQRQNALVSYNKANLYPSLRISASGGVDAFKVSNWFNLPAALFGIVGASIAQPIFERGQLRTQYKVSTIQREQAVIRFRQSVLAAAGEVSDALIQIDRLSSEGAIAMDRRAELDSSTTNASQLFRNGLVNYLEVLTAETSSLESQLEVATVKQQQLDATVDLYRALGGGWK
ncbi:MAG TPA: efflux RND transporter permease subunit [Puia sp.]|jgi:HAE1 family hydrophobic/amphiphilic exporter-1